MSCQSQLRCSAVGGPQLFESVIYPSINHLPLECKCLLASVSSECLLGFIVLAVLGLRCCAPAFSSCSVGGGLLFFVVCDLLIAAAYSVAEHKI